MLDKSKVGTVNSGEIVKVCDSCDINTQNGGVIGEIMGSSIIGQQIGGKIRQKTGNAIIVYTQKQKKTSHSVSKKNVAIQTSLTDDVKDGE